MPRLLICSLFILVLISFSCTKTYSGPTTASGQVIDRATGKPIPFAGVRLIKEKRGSFSGGLGSSDVDYQLADEQGRFSFSFTAEDAYAYEIWPQALYYFDGTDHGAIYSGDKNVDMKVSLQPKGWIRIALLNEHPIDTLNEIYIDGGFNPSFYRNTVYSDTAFTVEGSGLQRVIIWMRIKQAGKSFEIKDTVTIPVLDTVDYI